LVDDEARLQLTIWTRRVEKYKAKLDSFDQQIREAEARITTKSADREALKSRLAIAHELEDMRLELFREKAGTKINYLDAEAQRLQSLRLGHFKNTVRSRDGSERCLKTRSIPTQRRMGKRGHTIKLGSSSPLPSYAKCHALSV
jgi:hypothetical protein